MPVMPLQLMAVGVMDGIRVGRGVLDGVKVNVGGGLPGGLPEAGWVFVPKPAGWVICPLMLVGGMLVGRGGCVAVSVTKPGRVPVGILDGVADSAANESGMAEPSIATEIKNVRALAETIVNGSSGRIGMIGS